MKIAELKKQYPNIRFCELKSTPKVYMFNLSNLDEFLEITQKVGYIEENFGGEEYVNQKYTEYNFKCLKEQGISTLDSEVIASYLHKNEDVKNELKCLIAGEVGTNLYLYSLENNAMFESREAIDDGEEYEMFADRMEEIVEVAFEFRESCVEETDKKIRDCILSYKEQYNAALTKTNKEQVLQAVQLELKQKFDLDYRSDSRAQRVYIETLLNK